MYPDAKCELNYETPFQLLVATVLSAQTTDKGVNKVGEVLFSKYDTLAKLKDANLSDIKEIIKPIGNYNKKALNVIKISHDLINKYNGVVPRSHEELESLSGVGRKTANVILGELFDIPSFAVDTHVIRVSNRLNLVNSINPLEIEEKLKKIFKEEDWNKLHKQFVLFGRYYCKAKRPSCTNCKLKDICKHQEKN